ncbi:uncharacterized protein UV8b_06209 [Ustilaginoidea virens]|uniref:Steroid 5-alpha reductase C-terminal domain-containing protein n=1 Tax=Ustilaginoidea virens TaxID=1159556 RepID=A0A8E5HVA6_USTVR|nr:uncharacterized protein UV8b_06209 [Ustilaginoidea virens]QUC21968.1 hypothetical protein UV8b_06209 [Ustilaginoidea virens]
MFAHLLHITNFRSPLARAIAPCVAAALALQAAAALPSVLARSERFFDLSGSLTFLAVGALSLGLPRLRAAAGAGAALPSWRQVALTAMATAWTARLGIYLFDRITRDGHDARFERLRTQPLRFAASFAMQAAWVSLMLMPVLAVNAVPAAAFAAVPRVVATDAVGLALWAAGMAVEAVADAQKARWLARKRAKQHDEHFFRGGLFSICRFPHYFGEISLWTGLATVAAGVLARGPVQAALGLAGPAGVLATTALAFTAPAFSALLLLKVSGIPLTEARHDERFRDNADYHEWKANTPRLVPRLW